MESKQLPLIDIECKGLTRVFWLTAEHEKDPGSVERARALTANTEKPLLGLKGTYGLYASSAWWHNINNGIIPLTFVSGEIIKVYEAGQDIIGIVNTVDVKTATGQVESVGIYVNDENDIQLFKLGAFVEIVYANDERKKLNRDGTKSFAKLALEMAVSSENCTSA